MQDNIGYTVSAIVEAHRSGRTSPSETVRRVFERIRSYADPALFISLRTEDDVASEAVRLSQTGGAELPLFGVPVAIKDNIDVAGMETSAGCPAFAYMAASDATVVAKLRSAGAIVVGKTNLDQFATGLVGTRSPYGVPRNAIRSDLIPGGSSSGSAVAVAAGIVPIALGTDTAGSGRVPAMMNNIVGLKPSLGLVSKSGIVPACRTLDTVSVFALTVDDAFSGLSAIRGKDTADPYSREFPPSHLTMAPAQLRVGIPKADDRHFFGNDASAAFDKALSRLEFLGATLHEIDFWPYLEAARLLYEGPWLAERYLAIRDILESDPDSVHPITRQIISAARKFSAMDVFSTFYKLQELKSISDRVFEKVDLLAVPTAPGVYTIEEIKNDPIGTNTRLGTYTNFVNLLDLCAVSVPTCVTSSRIPFGVTLIAPAGLDGQIASVGRALHVIADVPLGALNACYPPSSVLAAIRSKDAVEIAVFGAHMSGLTLNHELIGNGAAFVRKVLTSNDYRLFRLPGDPPRPGLLRTANGAGASIEGEVWSMAADHFGRFVTNIPTPLSVGMVRLHDGSSVRGFLVEAIGVEGAADITGFGGWRSYCRASPNENNQPDRPTGNPSDQRMGVNYQRGDT